MMSLESANPLLPMASRMRGLAPSAVREILKVAGQPDVLSFAGGLPAPELFPVQELAEAHAEVLRNDGQAALQYSTTEGYGPLRDWIAARLAKRGMRFGAEDILITNGSQQGIDLVARVFLDPGDYVAVENPSYLAALQAFSGCEARLLPVPSDNDGMDVDALERAIAAYRPKLIYVVSDFHNPKGTTLSPARRQKLVAMASRYRIPILEDAPYHELRFQGEACPPVAAYDDTGIVIHLGTFSKTLAPGLRLGWLAGPKSIVQAATIVKQSSDLHTASLSQRAVVSLLERFNYDAHISRLREVYGERCRAMLLALERYMPIGTTWTRPQGGMFIWVKLPDGMNSEDVFVEALREKVAFVPGKSFFAGPVSSEFLRLNFSNRPCDKIDIGIDRLGGVLRNGMI